MGNLDENTSQLIDHLLDGLRQNPLACREQACTLKNQLEPQTNPLAYARLLYVEATADLYQSDAAKAQEKLQEGLKLISPPRDDAARTLYMSIRTSLGVCSLTLSKYAKAVYQFLDIKQLAVEQNDVYHYGYANIYLGRVYMLISMQSKALRYLQAAQEAVQVTGDVHQQGLVHLYLGSSLSTAGDVDEALNHLHAALECFESRQFAQTPEVLLTVGTIYLDQHDYLRSEQFLTIALDQAVSRGFFQTEVESLHLLARIDSIKDRSADAIDRLKRARNLAQQHGLNQHVLEIAKSLMGLYESIGAYEKAYTCSREVMEINSNAVQKKVLSDIRSMELSYSNRSISAERDFLKKRSASLRHSYDLIKNINSLADEINSLLNLDLMIDSLYLKLKQLFTVDAFSVIFFYQDRRKLQYRYHIAQDKYVQDQPDIDFQDRNSIEAYCARTRKQLLIRDVAAEGYQFREGPVSDKLNDYSSILLIPLEARGELLGVLSLKALEPDSYSSQDADVIKLLANQMAISTANFRIMEEIKKTNESLRDEKERLSLAHRELKDAHTKIEQLAIYDDLTGLPNRHLLYERSIPMLMLAKRNQTPFAVCFIDIDNFKPINDTLGHWAGDEALRILSRRMRKALRRSDLIARLGGDEFVAVFSDMKKQDSIYIILDKLIQALSQPLSIGREQFEVGASIGVSMYPQDASEFAELLNLADKAQYSAKHQGKNRYCVYSEMNHAALRLLKNNITS